MSQISQGHSVLIMTPKRHRRLDSLRRSSTYTFSIIKRNKKTAVGYKQSSLFKASGFVIVLAQCFAMMPLQGVTGRDISYIKFKWLSFKMLYSIFACFGSIITVVLYMTKFFDGDKEFTDIVNIVFYLSALINGILFIQLARNWVNLSEKWLNAEYFMQNYPYQPNLTKRFKITTGIIMILALGEHVMSIVKNVKMSSFCTVAKTNPMKAYFGHSYSHAFHLVSYSTWISLFLEIFNILATFTWNFSDLFVILMCAAMAEKFKQINKRIIISENKNETFWKEIREDFTRLSTLCKTLDSAICHIVSIAFGNNLFFICVQLFHTLKPFRGPIETTYFVCSFGFLLGRTAALSAYCCWINDESKYTLTYLFEIPSEEFGIEASRLIQQISFSPAVITGSNYFAVTRSLCLQVAGAIITFELILFQIGPTFLKTDANEEIFCVP